MCVSQHQAISMGSARLHAPPHVRSAAACSQPQLLIGSDRLVRTRLCGDPCGIGTGRLPRGSARRDKQSPHRIASHRIASGKSGDPEQLARLGHRSSAETGSAKQAWSRTKAGVASTKRERSRQARNVDGRRRSISPSFRRKILRSKLHSTCTGEVMLSHFAAPFMRVESGFDRVSQSRLSPILPRSHPPRFHPTLLLPPSLFAHLGFVWCRLSDE